MAPQIRCWTCRDRKISCDQTLPKCLNCARSKRQCGGYGLRLSWPRQTDRKRALIGCPSHGSRGNVSQRRKLQWINAFCGDVYLHHLGAVVSETRLFDSDYKVESRFQFSACPPESMLWITCELDDCHKKLLRYFETDVSKLLPMLDSDRPRILQILMQMALSDDSHSSKAVLQSMLALASWHHAGYQSHATRLKSSALEALIASTKDGLTTKAAIQHIAAGMLLCIFEQYLSKNSEWVGHMCGAKEVINAVQGECHAVGNDCSVILGWIYYYDVLARFSFRHWRTSMVKAIASELGFNPDGSRGCAIQYIVARVSFGTHIPNISSHCHPVLRLLFEVFDTVLYPWGPEYHAPEYRKHLASLKSGLENVTILGPDHGAAPMSVIQELEPVLELFRLASLIYLERASTNFSGQSEELDQWTSKAFSIFASLETCRHPFVLFILGCEARTDRRRLAILDLIERTEKDLDDLRLRSVKSLIQCAWVQEDLEPDAEIEYIRKLNLVLSTTDVVPIFV